MFHKKASSYRSIGDMGLQNDPTYEELMEKVQALEIENNRLRAKELQFQSFFNHAGISIFMVDSASGKIMKFNETAYENLGYTREEFGKLYISDIDGSVNENSIAERREENESGTRVFETIHKTKNAGNGRLPVETDKSRRIIQYFRAIFVKLDNSLPISCGI